MTNTKDINEAIENIFDMIDYNNYDFASESNISKFDILQQSGTSTLSSVNQSLQYVIELLLST